MVAATAQVARNKAGATTGTTARAPEVTTKETKTTARTVAVTTRTKDTTSLAKETGRDMVMGTRIGSGTLVAQGIITTGATVKATTLKVAIRNMAATKAARVTPHLLPSTAPKAKDTTLHHGIQGIDLMINHSQALTEGTRAQVRVEAVDPGIKLDNSFCNKNDDLIESYRFLDVYIFG